ncbi:MAG: hypothetical protein KKH98_07400 [Spirochaetes bacterium]|nr:hypothetical protein [Spirochaetota bacterium]
MKKILIFLFFIALTCSVQAQLTNTSSYQWENPLMSGYTFSGQTNLVSQFYKFVVTYNNFYLDLLVSGRDNNINSTFPGTTLNLTHYINNIGSSNENKGVALKLGGVPASITASLIRLGVPITNTPPIASGANYSYDLQVVIPPDYTGGSFSLYITNIGSTNSSPFPYRVVVRHTFNIIQQDILVHHASDGIHTITLFDGSQPLGNLNNKIYIQIQGTVVDTGSVKLYYDMNAAPDGSVPDGTVNRNRLISLEQEGDYWVGEIQALDPEMVTGNIVNFIVSADNNLYYNSGVPWQYIIREYAIQPESDDTISINNKFDPSAGETTYLIYKLNRKTFVNISVYNVRGEMVRTLKNAPMDIGKHSIEWDGKNDNGSIVSMGLYLVNIQTAEYGDTRKVIVIKR